MIAKRYPLLQTLVLSDLNNAKFDDDIMKRKTLPFDQEGFQLASFLQLSMLSLHSCDILDENLRDIGNLKNLICLATNYCSKLTKRSLEYISHISTLTRFEFMGWESPLDEILDSDFAANIPKLINLTELDLTDTNAGLEFCVAAKSLLRQLRLLALGYSDTNESCLYHITKHAKKLQVLELHCTRLNDEGLRLISHLPALQELDIMGCEEITDSGIMHISKLNGLRRLEISNCAKLMDTSLNHIGKICTLEKLSMSCDKFTDNGLQHLTKLKYLQKITYDYEMDRCITDEGRIQAGLPVFLESF